MILQVGPESLPQSFFATELPSLQWWPLDRCSQQCSKHPASYILPKNMVIHRSSVFFGGFGSPYQWPRLIRYTHYIQMLQCLIVTNSFISSYSANNYAQPKLRGTQHVDTRYILPPLPPGTGTRTIPAWSRSFKASNSSLFVLRCRFFNAISGT